MDVLIAASVLINCPIQRTDIEVKPWTRGYNERLRNNNVSLFSMSRSKSRESLFYWVGPFSKTRNVLFAKKINKISIKNKVDLNDYIIGAIRNDISQQLIKSMVISNSFRYANHPDNLARMLLRDRIDIWAYNYITAKWIFRKMKYHFNDFEVVYVLSENDNFFAFNKTSDFEAIQLLQKGIDMLKKNPGRYGVSQLEDIIRNYL